jgi:hypothetical protein
MKPKAAIRRFDVFAEFKRLEGLSNGLPDDRAKGYGLWTAKVVASRKFRRTEKPARGEPGAGKAAMVDGWHTLGGDPVTDSDFDREVIERMGAEFYDKVFAPEVAGLVEQGKDYMEFRDSVRSEWKP